MLFKNGDTWIKN